MSPEQPIKFRCDRCGQLLGVSPARAGKPVKCPKCGVALTVPFPGDPEPDRVDSPASSATATEAPSAPPSSGFFDAVDLDQDDLRNLFPVDAREDQDDEGSLPFEADADEDDDDDSEDEGVVIGPIDLTSPKPPGRGPIIEDVGGDGSESISALFAERSEGGQGRSGDPEPGVSAVPRMRASRDVLIPRMALLAWSLFVLLALFLAFLAGLLVGHFVWKG